MISLGQAHERRRKRREALEDLGRLMKERRSIMLVHYSCESFYNRPNGSSARITSIAVRAFATGQTTSFSIHQMAEREGIAPDQIAQRYDELEKQMLKEFSAYAKQHQDKSWVHWNMRDVNYGFPAIAHRSRVLGYTPSMPPEDKLFDLARTLYRLFGPRYAPHPRLKNVVGMNHITDLDMLDGKQEAEAFERGEYVKLHLSTLRKVDIVANILERVEDGRLKTAAPLMEQYGSPVAVIAAFLQEHPLAITLLAIIGVVGSIVTIIGALQR